MKLSAKVAAIQVAGDTVRVAVVKTGGKKPVVIERHEVRAEYAEIDKRHDALIVAIREAVAKVSSQPAGFVLCVSSLYAIARLLRVPFRGKQRIAKTVRFELEPYLAFPVEDVTVDFCIAHETEGETDVLAVGMRKQTLLAELDLLDEAGVSVESAVPDVSGLTALWWGMGKRGTAPVAVLHVRQDRCVLTVVHRKALAFVRQITRTVGAIDTDPAAVAREAQNSLRAFQAQWHGEESVNLLVVTGLDATPEQREAFDEAIAVPVLFESLDAAYALKEKAAPVLTQTDAPPPSIIPEALEPAEEAQEDDGSERSPFDEPFAVDDAPDDDSEVAAPVPIFDREPVMAPPRREPDFGDWAGLVGTAAAAAGTDFVFDFRRGELAPVHALQGVTKHLAFSGVIAAMALVGFGVYSFVQYQQNRAQIEAIGDQVWELFSRAKPDSPFAQAGRPANDFGGAQTMIQIYESDEFEQIEALRTTGDYEGGGGLSAGLFSGPTLLDHLMEVSRNMPGDEVKITDIRITPATGRTDSRIIITGEVVNMTAFDRAFARLRENAQTFTVDSQPATSLRDDVTRFTITALL